MRKTKIVATIGPACDSEEMVSRMIGAGVDVFRFNMKHNNMEWHSERMELVEQVCEKAGRRVGMLMDLQGPEIRIHVVPEKWQVVEKNQVVKFVKPGEEGGIELDHPEIFVDVREGQQVFADDGFLEFMVTKAGANSFEAKVVEGGAVKPRKTMNFPGMKLSFEALIERDIEQLSLAARHHVDFVALSFVRSAKDILLLKRELEKYEIDAMIIAKIEHPDAVERFEEILNEADGVMVARGDLGIEYPMEEVPALQKMMVRRCREMGKPVIVATQMLESMIEHARPTRAEVSDVANAVYDGADAIMLSGESAIGKYPLRAVMTMVKVTTKSELFVTDANGQMDWMENGQATAVVAAANTLIEWGRKGDNGLKAAVVLTESGETAEYLARMRPKLPIIGMSSSLKTLDEMNLMWGVVPVHFDYEKQKLVDVAQVMEVLKRSGRIHEGDKVVIVHGEIWGESGLTSVVRIQEIV